MAMKIKVLALLLCICICNNAIERAEAALSLSKDYYKQTCPNAENVIRETIRNATSFDPKIPARILRMHFHDCFIRGCDGSVLLDSTANNTAEKDAPPNVSLRAFYVIDDAKTRLESLCPQTVSCADILAIAARDVVVLAGGPNWDVLKGRKDGVISSANETRNLPAPSFNVSQLLQSFILRGLSLHDLVALSGGHTLGFSHCSSFSSRLHKFNATHSMDPSMQPQFAQSLLSVCPNPTTNRSAGAFLDSTSTRFDNAYFKRLVEGKGVFGSDQALFTENKTKTMVKTFAKDEKAFFRAFRRSMLKMGSVGMQTSDSQIRLNCRKVNS
ncbi:peroxidase 66 [Cryptomeria japonica]|uniref:peroxidase 66 n=1 Tax=Cryptomeria japonica TaxID=3369 RepID=UPI0025AC7CB5|nr:peroxidase 66 [Cryptomeria japonica]